MADERLTEQEMVDAAWAEEVHRLRERMEARGHRADALSDEEMLALAVDARVPNDRNLTAHVVGRIVLALHRWEPPPGIFRNGREVSVGEMQDGVLFIFKDTLRLDGRDGMTDTRIGRVQYAITRAELLHSDVEGTVRHIRDAFTAQARRLVQEARGEADKSMYRDRRII